MTSKGLKKSANNRNVMEAILWKIRTGATWRDIPEELCPWQTAFGSQSHLLSEHSQPAVNIELPESERPCISSEFAELYQKGLSLREIGKQTGKEKSVVRKRLRRIKA